MATMTAAQLDALMIQYQDEKIHPQFPQATPFLSEIEPDTGETWEPNQKGWKTQVYLQQEASNAYGGAGMTFPAGRLSDDRNFYIQHAQYAKTWTVDGPTYRDMLNNRKVLLDKAKQMARLMLNIAEQEEIVAWGDGSGVLARLLVSTTTSLALATTPNGTYNEAAGHDNLIEGGVYDILTSAGALADASHENVSFASGSISRSANTVTVATLGAAPADNSIIVWADGYNQAPRGLAYLIDGGRTGYFQGLDASSSAYLNSGKTDAGGQDIGLNYIQNAVLKHTLMNGGEATGMKLKICTHPTQVASYAQQGWNLVRFNNPGDEATFNVSFTKASYGGIQFGAFPKCDPDRLYIVDFSDLKRLVRKPTSIYNDDGQVFRIVRSGNSNTDAYEVHIGYEKNLAICMPKNHFVLTNLGTNGLATSATRFATT